MNEETITLDGNEFINTSRTYEYIRNLLPVLTVQCDIPSNRRIFNDSDPYTDPITDQAPWVSTDPACGEFYGMLVSGAQGIRDSTQGTYVTDLKGDGVIPGLRRHGGREVRFKLDLYASTMRGMEYGTDWLVGALSGGFCQSFDVPYCEGVILASYPHLEADTAQAALDSATNVRYMLDVVTLQGVTVLEQVTLPDRSGYIRTVEFTLVAGNPFIHKATELYEFTIQNPTWGTFAEVTCSPEDDSYESFITDPNLGDVVRPPRPPLVEPVQMPSSWRRVEQTIPQSALNVPGQVVFKVDVKATADTLRLMRLRFYRGTRNNCNYSGEFLITYLPQGAELKIDGTNKTIRMVLADGRTVPAGHLVIGSDGRPAEWPELDCRESVRLRVEYPSPIGNLTVNLEAINRR